MNNTHQEHISVSANKKPSTRKEKKEETAAAAVEKECIDFHR